MARPAVQVSKALTHAKVSQLKEIMHVFQSWKKIFPHIRQDYVKRKIVAKECIYHEGVIITYNKYKVKVKLGTVTIPKDSYILHQIVNANQGNGKASEVLDKFFDMVQNDNADLYLAVRSDNKLAGVFYVNKGFRKVGTIIWANGTLPGIIYKKQLAKHVIDML